MGSGSVYQVYRDSFNLNKKIIWAKILRRYGIYLRAKKSLHLLKLHCSKNAAWESYLVREGIQISIFWSGWEVSFKNSKHLDLAGLNIWSSHSINILQSSNGQPCIRLLIRVVRRFSACTLFPPNIPSIIRNLVRDWLIVSLMRVESAMKMQVLNVPLYFLSAVNLS